MVIRTDRRRGQVSAAFDIEIVQSVASKELQARTHQTSPRPVSERHPMFKFSTGVIIAATIAAAIGPAFAQQPSKPPAAPAASDTGQSPAPAGAHTYIINLKNGDTVTSPFKVQFGLTSNMGVAPAGVDKGNVGHHHLLIDTTLTAEEMTQPLISDAQHIHFGKGQTETTVTLPPGKHTLQLVLANGTHIPFNPPVQAEFITITVKAAAEPVAAAEIKTAPKEPAKQVTKEAPTEASKDAPKEVSKEVKATHRRHHHHRRYHHHREQYLHT